MKLKRILSIPIFSVIFVVGFVYYITVFIFIEDCYGLSSPEGSWKAMIFTLLGALFSFSFCVCVLTDPGGVPSQFLPDMEENPVSDQENKTTAVQQRHCDKCSTYKPPRAHHCRVCRRCVLRMDHHCVWINNCVGLRNYKAFVVLVVYATITCAYSLITILCCALRKDWDFSGRMPLKIFYITSGMMVLGLTLTMGTLLSWHIYLMARNMTTIEVTSSYTVTYIL
ncbi:OLC1v1026093C1 [Oldenlandia corymbosa var. corymbosa]|uniref:S-acyltransferase n=1 Tax=Oldenlandia corymbosa var. corymbosa TaxID=529605 RepID=A0AAV1C6X6_OLDCO|nr:OLC1v1026093C1 [Oldenlandia corymbosa var. corymbosa]